MKPDPIHNPVHMKVGDAAAGMRSACALSLTDRCWTQNPHDVTCQPCIRIQRVPYVEVDQETAYGVTTRMQRSVRVF